MTVKILPGKPYPLGATWDEEGVNFAIYSENAEKVELCLFDEAGSKTERERVAFREVTGHVWHAYLPDIKPGQLYGYRIHGTYEPKEGLRFNPAKLLIDPYAIAICGKMNWDAPVFSYQIGHADADLSFDDRDDAWGCPSVWLSTPPLTGRMTGHYTPPGTRPLSMRCTSKASQLVILRFRRSSVAPIPGWHPRPYWNI
jgi:pullulanase/glycogen debranching enzyme